MINLCATCAFQGNILQCEASDNCSVRGSWYVQHLQGVRKSMDHQSMTEIATLEGQLGEAKKRVEEAEEAEETLRIVERMVAGATKLL
jgi:hypothetical protein